MPAGYYHSIETFGTVDGPGIRYVLFLSGCGLRCGFCHNVDTWEPHGRQISIEQVLTGIDEFRAYYDSSGGGLTVSGGEPALQPDFVAALFQACRERDIHTLLDTGGYCPPSHIAKLLTDTDCLQFSIKTVCPDKHKILTGQDNAVILANLRRVAATHIPFIVRYIVIPDVNNSPADLQLLADLLHTLPRSVKVELLPYHTLGKEKWDKAGLPYPLPGIPAATRAHMETAREFLVRAGNTIL